MVLGQQSFQKLLDRRVPGDQEPMETWVGVEHGGEIPGGSSLGQIGDLIRFEKEQVVHHRIKVREHRKDESGCKHPTQFRLEAKERGATLLGTYVLGKVHDRYEVLDRLPWPLRKLVEAFIGNPTFLRFRNKFQFVVEKDGKKIEFGGKGSSQVVCLHP